MKLAAAAIMVSTKPTVAQGVAILEAALKDAAGDRERTNIEIALAEGYSIQDNFAGLLDVFVGAAEGRAGIEAGVPLQH